MSEKDKISLEDLLKLKRAERPDEAEWRRFDENLKRAMLCRMVGRKRSLSIRSIGGFLTRRAAAGAAALAALSAAVFAPVYMHSISGSSLGDFSGDSISDASPLPNLAASYLLNELPAEGANFETPVFAQMNAPENSSIRYVESGIGGGQVAF